VSLKGTAAGWEEEERGVSGATVGVGRPVGGASAPWGEDGGELVLSSGVKKLVMGGYERETRRAPGWDFESGCDGFNASAGWGSFLPDI